MLSMTDTEIRITVESPRPKQSEAAGTKSGKSYTHVCPIPTFEHILNEIDRLTAKSGAKTFRAAEIENVGLTPKYVAIRYLDGIDAITKTGQQFALNGNTAREALDAAWEHLFLGESA